MFAFTFPVAMVPGDKATPALAAIFVTSAMETLFALTFRSSTGWVGFEFTVPFISRGVEPSFIMKFRIVNKSAPRSSVKSYCATIGKPSSMPRTFAFWIWVSPCAVSFPDSLLIFVSPLTDPSVPFTAGEFRNFDKSPMLTCLRLRVPRKGVATGLPLLMGPPRPCKRACCDAAPDMCTDASIVNGLSGEKSLSVTSMWSYIEGVLLVC